MSKLPLVAHLPEWYHEDKTTRRIRQKPCDSLLKKRIILPTEVVEQRFITFESDNHTMSQNM